jgi:hypothetical protein
MREEGHRGFLQGEKEKHRPWQKHNISALNLNGKYFLPIIKYLELKTLLFPVF